MPVKVYAKSYEEAEYEAVLEGGRVIGQDIDHLVTEIEGV